MKKSGIFEQIILLAILVVLIIGLVVYVQKPNVQRTNRTTKQTKSKKSESIVQKHLEMMHKLHKERKFYQAFTAAKRAFELEPTNGEFQFNVLREKAFVIAGNLNSVNSSQAADLLYDVNYLLESDPDNKSTYLTARGNIKIVSTGFKYENVVKDFEEAIKLDGSNLSARIQLARLYAGKKDKKAEALKEYATILKQDPENFAGNSGLGDIYLTDGKYSKALDQYKKAQKSGNTFMLNLNMGIAYYNTKAYKKALQSFAKAKQLNPKKVETYRWITRLFMNAKQWKDAEREVRAALKLSHDHDLYFNLAIVLSREKRYKDALEIFNSLLSLNPDDLYVLYETANLMEQANNIPNALFLYKKIVKAKKFDSDAEKKWHETIKKELDKKIKVLTEKVQKLNPKKSSKKK